MLELRAVSYRYPGYRRAAIAEIDLAVAAGEIVGVVGPNGAGKSTVCLVAAGLAPASIGGELTGQVVIERDSTRGIVFSNPASQLSGIAATVFEEVALGPVNLGLPVAETLARTRESLAAMRIEALAERHPARLSGGQQQLVAIAAMLAMRPGVLVLDEPVAELDTDERGHVGEALRSIADAGTAVLVAEHDLDLLAAIDARLVTLRDGRFVG